jgi:hypothetical protein
MPITLNHSNIGVQYNTGSNYIIETVKSDLYLRNEIYNTIVRDNIQAAPVTPIVSIQDGSNVYAVESYTYSGTANTADYTRVFPKNTVCDILIVGGGGAGGYFGGGGGAGQLLLATNLTISAQQINIKVGKGGSVNPVYSATSFNGSDSSITINSVEYIAKGGGGGGSYNNSTTNATGGANGGSGGGSSGARSNTSGAGGTSTKNTYTNWTAYGNNGGSGSFSNGGFDNHYGGGGGGAGAIGGDGVYATNTAGNGGVGVNMSSYFGTGVGASGWFGGGGGGHSYQQNYASGTGGTGGGGSGGKNFGSVLPIAGTANTGGGGGGGNNSINGSGGSGIIIIRYLVGTIPSNNLLTEPTVISPVAFTESIRTFAHSGGTETQTTHTITVGQNTICDILVVGGGGGGGFFGGGGGGGAILFANNITLGAGSYTIKVGKGGTGVSTNSQNGTNGIDSSITINSVEYIARGGGGGGTREGIHLRGRNGNDGGSGGGGSHSNDAVYQGIGGISNKNTYSGWLSYGNNGGKGRPGVSGSPDHASGGGGGAGSVGGDFSYTTGGGNGGSGMSFVSTFGTSVGHNGWFGGGGGGNTYGSAGNPGYGNGGNGLLGGGGNGGFDGVFGSFNENPAQDGLPNTGGGGGGAKYDGGTTEDFDGGDGGSGIVIIKFKSLANPIPEGNPITHKRLNFAFNSDNLVAWYRFNGNYLDSSGNGHNLTNVGSVIQSTQVIEGQAIEFDSTDYLEFPASINPYTIWNGKGITFSFWVRFTAHELWSRLFEFQPAASTNSGIFVSVKANDGTPYAIWLNIGGTFFKYSNWNDPLITNLNVWRYFVFCVSSSGKWDVYLDNVRINGTETANIPNITYNIRYINRSAYAGDGTWDGQMDDFRIYDRALSAADVSLLYNKTYSIPPNTYTLNFPVPTIADINNNSNIVLRGAYDISLSTTNSSIIPKSNQYISPPTIFTNYSIERMYPPVRNFTAATTTVSGQTYGNGTYVVSFSATYGNSIDPWTCFNTANVAGGAWPDNRYTAGVFNSTSFIVAGYLGDWLKIQLPVAIKLTRFEILMRTDETQQTRERSPKDFKIYGSNDNITWVELVNKTDAVYDSSFRYIQLTPEITNAYTYYALVVNKILSTVASLLNFDEWYIYGQEVLPSSLSIRYNLLNPILDPIGAQWTYNSSNTNVYHMGRVGIGTKSPEYQLDVRGTIYSSLGGYTSSALTKWSVLSDRRIKENIVKASYDKCLENVKNIELYNFNFKDNCVNTNDRHQLGFIAQEVQQVYPKAVEVSKMILNLEEKIDDLLTLNITQIDYTLYGAVKSLIEKMENIKIKMEQIKTAYDIP